MVGYVAVELYVRNGHVYVLERRKLGFYVMDVWRVEDLFKIFSDREESRLRLVFRSKAHRGGMMREVGQNGCGEGEMEIKSWGLQHSDMNLLGKIVEQANLMDISCE